MTSQNSEVRALPLEVARPHVPTSRTWRLRRKVGTGLRERSPLPTINQAVGCPGFFAISVLESGPSWRSGASAVSL